MGALAESAVIERFAEAICHGLTRKAMEWSNRGIRPYRERQYGG